VNVDMDFALQVLGILASAGAVYAAIRSDLAGLKVKADMALKAADGAHKRLDDFLTNGVCHARRENS